MSDIIGNLVGELAKAGAPALGKIIGGAIGGPAGTVIGGLAGKALEATAEALGVDPEPTVVAAEIAKDRIGAADKLAPVEAAVPSMIPVWQAEIARAAANDAVEAEKGFGAWAMRRTVTTYLILAMLGSSFFAALAATLGIITIKEASLSLLIGLVGSAGTWFMAWNGLVSGGRALTDVAKAVKGQK